MVNIINIIFGWIAYCYPPKKPILDLEWALLPSAESDLRLIDYYRRQKLGFLEVDQSKGSRLRSPINPKAIALMQALMTK